MFFLRRPHLLRSSRGRLWSGSTFQYLQSETLQFCFNPMAVLIWGCQGSSQAEPHLDSEIVRLFCESQRGLRLRPGVCVCVRCVCVRTVSPSDGRLTRAAALAASFRLPVKPLMRQFDQGASQTLTRLSAPVDNPAPPTATAACGAGSECSRPTFARRWKGTGPPGSRDHRDEPVLMPSHCCVETGAGRQR